MKKVNFLLVYAIAVILVFSGFSFLVSGKDKKEKIIQIPENVDKVLQKSCVGCHSSTSQNEKSRDALSFDTWQSLSTTKKISKLDEINEVVSEGKMPPARFLERFPDKKLNPVEAKLVADWAKKESKKLSK